MCLPEAKVHCAGAWPPLRPRGGELHAADEGEALILVCSFSVGVSVLDDKV